MLALLKRAGISEYSIFRREELLVLSMRVEDFDVTWDMIERDPVNTRWQKDNVASILSRWSHWRPASGFP